MRGEGEERSEGGEEKRRWSLSLSASWMASLAAAIALLTSYSNSSSASRLEALDSLTASRRRRSRRESASSLDFRHSSFAIAITLSSSELISSILLICSASTLSYTSDPRARCLVHLFTSARSFFTPSSCFSTTLLISISSADILPLDNNGNISIGERMGDQKVSKFKLAPPHHLSRSKSPSAPLFSLSSLPIAFHSSFIAMLRTLNLIPPSSSPYI